MTVWGWLGRSEILKEGSGKGRPETLLPEVMLRSRGEISSSSGKPQFAPKIFPLIGQAHPDRSG